MQQNIIVDIPARLNPGDVIVYENGKWIVQTKSEYLKDTFDYINKENYNLKQENIILQGMIKATNAEIESVKEDILAFKKNVNTKLKEHHNVLNALTGGDK